MFAGPLGRSTFTPPKSSFDSPLYGLVSLRRSHTALMAVSVSTGEGFTQGQPQALLESPNLLVGGGAYDVSADGQRFVTIAPVEDDDQKAEAPSIRVVENWAEEFRDREQ